MQAHKGRMTIIFVAIVMALSGCSHDNGHVNQKNKNTAALISKEVTANTQSQNLTSQPWITLPGTKGSDKATINKQKQIVAAFTRDEILVTAAVDGALAGQTTQTKDLNKTNIGGCANVSVEPSAIGPTMSAAAIITLNSLSCSPHMQDEIDKSIDRKEFGGVREGVKSFHIVADHGDAAIAVSKNGSPSPSTHHKQVPDGH